MRKAWAVPIGLVGLLALSSPAARAQAAAATRGDEIPFAAAPPPEVPPPQVPAPVKPSARLEAAAPVEPTYLKLREIEERVNQLKERVFQSKARLVQLQEVVLHGAIAGAKLVLFHHNEMGSAYKLSQLEYALDGSVIFHRQVSEAADMDKLEDLEIFSGPVSPGSHELTVSIEYGGGSFGFFSYVEAYTYRIRSTHTLMADEGKVTSIKVVGYENGGLATDLKDRPAVRFDTAAAGDLKPTERPAAGGASTGASSS